jgi:hypothetical protein
MKASVDKAKLLTVLHANRGQHRAIFEEAVEGYREEAVKQLEDYLARIKKGSLKRVYISIPVPEDHTADYDRTIGLIEMGQEALVSLSDDEYRMYVLDEWDWKQHFLASNSAYSVTAAKLVGDDDEEDA